MLDITAKMSILSQAKFNVSQSVIIEHWMVHSWINVSEETLMNWDINVKAKHLCCLLHTPTWVEPITQACAWESNSNLPVHRTMHIQLSHTGQGKNSFMIFCFCFGTYGSFLLTKYIVNFLKHTDYLLNINFHISIFKLLFM